MEKSQGCSREARDIRIEKFKMLLTIDPDGVKEFIQKNLSKKIHDRRYNF